MSGLIQRWFFRPVDASSLAVFRMLFGACLLFEAVNYGLFLCLDCLYRNTAMQFKFHHFEWVGLWPGIGLELHFLVLAIASIGVILGLFYRVSMTICTLAFAYLFLLDQAYYLNHFYLVILFATIMIFVPAHRVWSLDAWRRPERASRMVPNWGRFWLAAQLEIVLLYAGFVKLTWDWLNLEPMRLWMNWRSADAGPLMQWLTEDWGIALASYGVIALHLIGAPLLLWRRTRLVVFFVYCFFHATNALVFNIGIFPFITLGATLLLFDPDWPRQLARRLHRPGRPGAALFARLAGEVPDRSTLVAGNPAAGNTDADTAAALAGDRAADDRERPTAATTASARSLGRRGWARAAIVATVMIWLAVQVVVPLRHFMRPGDVAWNEDGHRFSWRMKLRSKQGRTHFAVVRDDGRRWVIDPAHYLNGKQTRKMACIPDLIWQFAQFLEDRFDEGGRHEVAVYAEAMCSLNTREPAPLTQRLVDLTEIPRTHPVTEWTFPNGKSLPNPLF